MAKSRLSLFGLTTQRNAALRHIPIKAAGIYRITNERDGKFYIGSAGNVRRRLRGHLLMLRANEHPSPHLQRAWNRDGEASFRFDLIEEVSGDLAARLAREQFWLDTTRCFDDAIGYNVSPRADAGPIRFMTPEERAAVSERFKGKPKSEEHRRKIGEAQRWRTHTAEQREHLRARATEQWADPEARAAQSARRKGSTPWNKGRKIKPPLSEAEARQTAEDREARRLAAAEKRRANIAKGRQSITPEARAAGAQKRAEKLKGKARPERRRLPDETVREIRRLHAEGWSYGALGKRFGMNPGHLYKIVTRRTYADVAD